MSAKYEERHRELREALASAGEQYRAGVDPEDAAAVIGADRALDAFRERTASPVDDLVAVVREGVRLDELPDTAWEPMRTDLLALRAEARRRRIIALAALDEAAGRGA